MPNDRIIAPRFLATYRTEYVFNQISAASFVNSSHKPDGIRCRGRELPLAIIEGGIIQCAGQYPGKDHFASIERASIKRRAIDHYRHIIERLVSRQHYNLLIAQTGFRDCQ